MMAFSVKYGGKRGKRYSLRLSNEFIAVRMYEGEHFENVVRRSQHNEQIVGLRKFAQFDRANVVVMRALAKTQTAVKRKRDKARAAIKSQGVRFAGRVLVDPKSNRPVLYTENFFVRFQKDLGSQKCKAILKAFQLNVSREYEHVPNTFFVKPNRSAGLDATFAIGDKLLGHKCVELCHPELVRERSFRTAFKHQWHLKRIKIGGRTISAHASVEDAWEISTGKDTTICVIDDGVDVDHQDFSSAGKVIYGRDITQRSNNPRPKQPAVPKFDFEGDAHGTACAGVACASGKHAAAGVAPDAKLLPIRHVSNLGSQDEHDAILWAVEHGADVISCSWGPLDGDWSDPNDPLHDQVTPMPDSTRSAIEFAVDHGRNGKGCVIAWAAGNGNESVDNDGYASSDFVMAVAACNDRSKKSVYSDHGDAIWCCFPSSNFDVEGQPKPRTPGIWTTDRSDGEDEGYTPHFSEGDSDGKYTSSFGGTSSACPGVAGVAALVISANPELNWDEVCNLIADTCDRIDKSGGDYDSETKHSRLYGFGRVNAKRAVKAAIKIRNIGA